MQKTLCANSSLSQNREGKFKSMPRQISQGLNLKEVVRERENDGERMREPEREREMEWERVWEREREGCPK